MELLAESNGVKIYAGDRTIDGIVVTADGKPLDECTELRQFSPLGFEWSYEGPESRQLALAILAHHLGDDARALELSEAFMREVVAYFDNTWEMSSADVQAAIEAIV